MAFISYFIAVPRIILNDQSCSQTEKLVYGMINSLSNNKEYCYASNKYFANSLNVKEKTISNSINNLKRKNYIDIKFINGQRRIYLNNNIIAQENTKVLAKNVNDKVVKNYQDTRKEYTRNNYKKINVIPYWMKHLEICQDEELTGDELKNMEDLLKDFKED